jgi:hypothetical protein
MKKYFFLCLFLCLNFNAISQTIYSSNYKYISLKSTKDTEPTSEFSDGFLESLVYNFYSNSKVCYLESTSTAESIGVSTKVSGDQNIFINFENSNVAYRLDNLGCYNFKKVNFRKVKSNSIVEILGFKTTKYVSDDNNLVLYTTKLLPWYVQPCLFNSNQLDESIVRFENIEKKYGLELIKFDKVNKSKEFDANMNKILNKKCKTKAKEIICPFFK